MDNIMIVWPEFRFPGINLWNYPKQNKDYMRNIAQDKRSARLQLKPKKCQTSGFNTGQVLASQYTPQQRMNAILNSERISQCCKIAQKR